MIETYMYRSDPFRATSAPHPLPYPLQFSPIQHDLGNKIREQYVPVEEILHRHGLLETFSLSAAWVSKPGYPYGDSPRLTILIQVRGRGSNFGPIRDALVQHFDSVLDTQADVEVIHPDYSHRPSLFPITPIHPAVDVYKQVKDALVVKLEKTIPSQWRLITLLSLGQNLARSSPTVVIMVRPGSLYNWSHLTASIRHLVSENTPSGLFIDVEVIPGSITSTTPDTCSPAGIDQSSAISFDSSLGMGLSIGDHDQTRVGTMGGLVLLTHHGKTRTCAITNYHVIRPTAMVDQADRFGSTISASNLINTKMMFFAPVDVEATIDRLKDDVKEYQNELSTVEEISGRIRVKGNPVPTQLDSSREYLRKCLAEMQSKLKVSLTMPRVLGRVLCSSGQGLWNSCVQDWALIELDPDAIPFLTCPNKMPSIEPRNLPSAYGQGPVMVEAGTPLCDFGEIEPGMWYTRVGRTSTHSGVANGVRACLNWVDVIRYDFNGEPIKMSKWTTEEHLILNRRTRGEFTQMEFGLPGDSGSLLINRFGKICGLYYGTATSWLGPNGMEVVNSNAGLAMTMADVIEGINLKIGADQEAVVSLP